MLQGLYLKMGLAEGSQGCSTTRQIMEEARKVEEVVLAVEVHQRPVAHEGVARRAQHSAQQAQRRHGLQTGLLPRSWWSLHHSISP